MPEDKSLYDWGTRWKDLNLIDKKTGGVNLIIGKEATFMEMYRLGFLTGKAKSDAENIVNGKIKFGEE